MGFSEKYAKTPTKAKKHSYTYLSIVVMTYGPPRPYLFKTSIESDTSFGMKPCDVPNFFIFALAYRQMDIILV